MQPCLLIYDIPDESELENPSNRLRRIAVRVNLSCWVILEENVPYNYLNYLKENGAEWHVVRFDIRESAKLIGMAIDSIKKEIRDSISRAKASFQNNCQKLGDTDKVPEDKLKRYDANTKATVKRLKQTLADLRASASLFGIDDSTLNVAEAYSQVRSLQTSMHKRAEEYSRVVNELAAARSNNDGMVQAARADQVPPGILADYADDHGINGTARLRGLFD